MECYTQRHAKRRKGTIFAVYSSSVKIEKAQECKISYIMSKALCYVYTCTNIFLTNEIKNYIASDLHTFFWYFF